MLIRQDNCASYKKFRSITVSIFDKSSRSEARRNLTRPGSRRFKFCIPCTLIDFYIQFRFSRFIRVTRESFPSNFCPFTMNSSISPPGIDNRCHSCSELLLALRESALFHTRRHNTTKTNARSDCCTTADVKLVLQNHIWCLLHV